jgi:hypothetical protein
MFLSEGFADLLAFLTTGFVFTFTDLPLAFGRGLE